MTKFFGLRERIAAWFMLIVALALGINLAVVADRLTNDLTQTVVTEIEHEAKKFRNFADTAINPNTNARYHEVADLLRNYLRHYVPEDDEALFTVVNGLPGHRTRTALEPRLDLRPEIVAKVAAANEPFTETLDTESGLVVYSALPITGSDSTGALVIVEYLANPQEATNWLIQLMALVSLAAWLIAAVASWFIAQRIVSPLRRMRVAADSIHETELTRRIPVTATDPGDDMTALQLTFNKMLDRLETAFTSQREFLDDAAHELRTPLTVIRGHLELDEHRDPANQALLLDEVDRMNRIVDDLLVLAKSGRPDFLTIDPVDLTDLVVSVVAKASPLAPRRWEIPDVAPISVFADGQRLTQALMQLVSNAIDATKTGDTIAVAAQVVADTVYLSVSDSGPGIPAAERATIFQRFERGARNRPGSSGLGLAIVASIAAAHGGTATVAESASGGAKFVLAFPVRTEPVRPEQE